MYKMVNVFLKSEIFFCVLIGVIRNCENVRALG